MSAFRGFLAGSLAVIALGVLVKGKAPDKVKTGFGVLDKVTFRLLSAQVAGIPNWKGAIGGGLTGINQVPDAGVRPGQTSPAPGPLPMPSPGPTPTVPAVWV